MPINLIQRVQRRAKATVFDLRQRWGPAERDEVLVEQAQRFWAGTDDAKFKSNSHWRDGGVFDGNDHWSRLGREHLGIYQTFAGALPGVRAPRRVGEWGCGGGANAVHFGKLGERFYGVDISQPSLDECANQLTQAGIAGFVPVLVTSDDPHAALRTIDEPCDLLLCTYVFELLPSPAYGLRLLQLFRQLLNDNGLAVIQIKYHTADVRTRARRWAYAENLANNTTYGIDEFWTAAKSCGFRPELIHLVPRQPMVNDGRYAFYALGAS